LFVGAIGDISRDQWLSMTTLALLNLPLGDKQSCGVKKSDILEHHIKEFFDEELVDRWLIS
jgi:hypothetical protein